MYSHFTGVEIEAQEQKINFLDYLVSCKWQNWDLNPGFLHLNNEPTYHVLVIVLEFYMLLLLISKPF